MKGKKLLEPLQLKGIPVLRDWGGSQFQTERPQTEFAMAGGDGEFQAIPYT